MISLFIRGGSDIGTVQEPKGALLIREDGEGNQYLELQSLDSKTVVQVTDEDIPGILRMVCNLWSE